jgi:hypothetical protein
MLGKLQCFPIHFGKHCSYPITYFNKKKYLSLLSSLRKEHLSLLSLKYERTRKRIKKIKVGKRKKNKIRVKNSI